MAQEETLQALDGIETALHAIDPDQSPDENYAPLHALMHAALRLGIAMDSDPEARCEVDVRNQIESQGRRLGTLLHLLTYYIARWEQRFWGEFTSRWLDLCYGRSGLEYLQCIYGSDALSRDGDCLDADELADLDRHIRDLMEHEGGIAEENIPRGVPASHWWWR